MILLSYRCYNILFGFWIMKRLSHQPSLRLRNIGVWYHFVFSVSHVNQNTLCSVDTTLLLIKSKGNSKVKVYQNRPRMPKGGLEV